MTSVSEHGLYNPNLWFLLIGKMMSFTENTGQPRVRCVDEPLATKLNCKGYSRIENQLFGNTFCLRLNMINVGICFCVAILVCCLGLGIVQV
jgi:hypothetical protein